MSDIKSYRRIDCCKKCAYCCISWENVQYCTNPLNEYGDGIQPAIDLDGVCNHFSTTKIKKED